MSRNQNICRHPSFMKLSSKVYMCKECSVLSFNTSSNQKVLLTNLCKPPIFNKKITENPLEIFQVIFDNTFYSSDETEFSEVYKSYRLQLIKYIKKMCISHRLSAKSFYLSVALLDILCKKIEKNNTYLFEVFSSCCFILAMKFIETDPPTPDYTDFRCLDNKNLINSRDLYKYEVSLLKELGYNLNVVTAYDILGILFQGGIVFESEVEDKPQEFLRNVYNYAKKILDKAIENEIISERYNPVQIAFSAVYLSRKVYGLNLKFKKYFKIMYGMNYSFYSSCVKDISCLDTKGKVFHNSESKISSKLDQKTQEDIVIIEEPHKQSYNYYSKSFAKSIIDNSSRSSIVLPLLSSQASTPIPTEPSRNISSLSTSISSLKKSIKFSGVQTTLTHKLRMSKFITKKNYEPKSSTNLRGLINISDITQKTSSKGKNFFKFKLPKI